MSDDQGLKSADSEGPDTTGGNAPEAVVDRPGVSVVTPDDYPEPWLAS